MPSPEEPSPSVPQPGFPLDFMLSHLAAIVECSDDAIKRRQKNLVPDEALQWFSAFSFPAASTINRQLFAH